MTTILLTAVDDRLSSHVIEPDTGALTLCQTQHLPAKVQYAWRHPNLPVLYAACSASGPRVRSEFNVLVALRISPDGQLTTFGTDRRLPLRAVHISTDPDGCYLLAAHNFGGGALSVLPVEEDGGLGQILPQNAVCDFGIYPHQVRVFPSGRAALVVDRGINANSETGERPGALRSYTLTDGQASPRQVIAPNGGFGFGPRHVDFHPSRPWLYAADERFNRLMMFGISGDMIESHPRWTLDMLADRGPTMPRQLGGAIHVHPRGHVVYAANRADATQDHNGMPVFAGGENSIAVFAIDPESGEPTPIQNTPIEAIHARTFSVDPSGKLLVAASIKALQRLTDGRVTPIPARLSLFRIGDDGRLNLLRVHDVETSGSELQYWSGLIAL